MSELSKRISADVETQGRLQLAAAQCAQRLAAHYESAAGSHAIRDLAPSLILAWLEGYESRLHDEIAHDTKKLHAAESESHALKSRGR